MEAYAERNAILRELGFRDYREYLRSKLWKSIRERKLAQDPECYGCFRNEDKAIMQVHHGAYTAANLRGETLTDLWTVCSRCHKYIEVTKSGHKRNPEDATDELRVIRQRAIAMRNNKPATQTGLHPSQRGVGSRSDTSTILRRSRG